MATAKWIRDRRAAAGLTQAELGRKVGASQPLISLWERGTSEPPPDVLKKLRTVLEGKLAKKKDKAAKRDDLELHVKLWAVADRLRDPLAPADYKHVVLGLIFLKYVSDSFEELRARLERDPETDAEDRDHYLAENVFWVPPEARWSNLLARAKSPGIGKAVDDAMVAIERENPSLRGVLPKEFGRPSLERAYLGELIDLVSTIGLGDSEPTHPRVFEHLLRTLPAEGRSGGEFYTPHCLTRLLVKMLEPLRGRVYDPCIGLGGMLVQVLHFVLAHGGRAGDVALYGQESNLDAWRLATMSLAVQGVEADLGPQNADTLLRDLHPDLRADFVLADPPFNVKYAGGEPLRQDARWRYGLPPTDNANYAWIQHCIHHLSPTGTACLLMPHGSMSSNRSSELEIRRRIVEDDLLGCMVALPGHLHLLTSIPVCLWCVARSKAGGPLRDRRGEVLFIDASSLGDRVGPGRRELSDEDVAAIARTWRAWRGESGAGRYEDKPGFCRTVRLPEIAAAGYALHPQRFVDRSDLIVPEPVAQVDPTYLELLEDLKGRIQAAQLRAMLAVNREMILLYWQVGRQILDSQGKEGWGARVIERLADDLQGAFPAVEGFSARNLKYMRAFASAWPDESLVQDVLARITWSHNITILEKVKAPAEREFYARQCIAYGWSRNILVHHVESELYSRRGKALTNFDKTLLQPQSDLASEALKDPYVFDFLSLGPEVRERELEQALLVHVRDFLLEMGAGFALVGSQFHLQVGDRDFYLDLLFYHLRLRCYVVVDLKVGDFLPEHAGKMNFYLSAVDDLLRHPDDKDSIGLILCKTQDRLVARYSLHGVQRPIGVATYRLMPESFKEELPSPEALEGLLEEIEDQPR